MKTAEDIKQDFFKFFTENEWINYNTVVKFWVYINPYIQQTSELRKENERLEKQNQQWDEDYADVHDKAIAFQSQLASLQSQLEEKDRKIETRGDIIHYLESEIKALKEINNALVSIMNQHYEGLTIDEVLALPSSQDNKEKI